MVLNLYASNRVWPRYTKHILKDLKGKIGSKSIIVGDYNTPLIPIDRLSRQRISKETLDLRNH